ncbi:MAG: thioredoxin [Bacteroidota bacterium]
MKKILLVVFATLLFVMALPGLESCKSGKESIVTLTADNFSSETAKGIVLVDFWATWCMPCRAMAPVIEEIASQTQGKIKVGKVDIDINKEAANQFHIVSIPTIIIFKDGVPMETLVGIQSKETLVNALSKYIKLQ